MHERGRRGGPGFTFRTHPVSEATLFGFDWPWSLAGKAVAAWFDWIPDLPDEAFTACQLSGAPTTGPKITVFGVVLGPLSAIDPITAPLASALGAPSSRFSRNHTYLDAMYIEAGCQGVPAAACHFAGSTPQGTLARSAFLAKSDYFTAPPNAAAIGALTNAIERRTTDARLLGGAAQFDAYGGAINRVAPDATAFVHRRALCSAQYSGQYDPAAPADHLAANRAWLQTMYTELRPAASGAAYPNYIDPTLTGWREAYYGANYKRLVSVQRHYDPQHRFRFPQAVGT